MAAFYFISGYISGNKNQKLSVLLKEKAKRLLFPCFVYGVVLVGIDVILSGTQGSLNKLIGVFYSRYMLFPHDLNNNVFFLKSYNSILWFLTSMFLTSICFDAFRKCQRKKIFVLPILKGLIFVGRHTMTYMCLQIFTLAISYKVFMFVHINDVVSGWIGVCVTLIMIWLVIKFYEAVSKKIKLFKYL